MNTGYAKYQGKWGANAQLALDTIAMKPTKGIPHWMLNIMDWDTLEHVAGARPGDYEREPEKVCLACQINHGAAWCDQWIPRNPLSMRKHGYESTTAKSATTGVEQIVVDGRNIDSPEAVAEHLEQVEFPRLEKQIAETDADSQAAVDALIAKEVEVQELFGPNLLKGPYANGFQAFPRFRYGKYGYVNYFMAYALFPELMARDFRLQGDLAVKLNTIAARAIVQGGLPRLLRLDHDMADSRGTLVDIRSLDEIWFPHFARSIEPFLKAGIRLIWHCDGNLMQMVPRLLAVGLGGFQGFQYEDGMDYEKICRMKDRDGNPLFIVAGCSVTRTLPHGTVADVKKELKWVVDQGPRVGLFLGGTSSIAPNTNRQNVLTFIEGLKYYQEHGRG
jgi:hypothetical protein